MPNARVRFGKTCLKSHLVRQLGQGFTDQPAKCVQSLSGGYGANRWSKLC
ncbi:hypothetical protein M758_7G125000 [Ceratodon purpureus]|uniref:Uncharacterized protein n=1 Tax=Ceratodon purpureus TaxID=3225 RepID=A0A8T0HF50_CERPU|nr:hypothetical protein KC19_7G152200 [Ceratodon purpureus]KAG0611231.1 hypothetical protein M758_7G125000 [Ceratodon purpureus]